MANRIVETGKGRGCVDLTRLTGDVNGKWRLAGAFQTGGYYFNNRARCRSDGQVLTLPSCVHGGPGRACGARTGGVRGVMPLHAA